MDKTYNHEEAENKWYKFWEEHDLFKPEINPDGEPYTIILPPPNASGKMHTGNVLMIAIEDLLIRWHRMRGFAALWVPGTDHAGTETQITFERELRKQDKSRFNYTRTELYKMIWDFVMENKGNIERQIREMGASVDWSRYKFTLDPEIVANVHQTFKKMAKDGLIYKGEYMVNYCPKCGTTYSDVELTHEEQKDPLYYIKYKLADEEGCAIVATVRPETIPFDTHLAIHPENQKTSYLKNKQVLNPITHKIMDIIEDEFVDPEFGTGIVKLTPAVDKDDYEVALKHRLPLVQVLDWNGKLVGRYEGLSVENSRTKAIEELGDSMEKIDNTYLHNVAYCKAGHNIEPMVIPNWFVKVDLDNKSFKDPALQAVVNKKINIFPQWQEITYIRWMEQMRDWPVSRQNVWGINIPVFYEIENPSQFYVWFTAKDGKYQHGTLTQFIEKGTSLEEIIKGLQRVVALPAAKWVVEEEKDPNKKYLPETDTFDTWFSSGQWPLLVLGYPDSPDFKKFYPTSVMETGWDIVKLWVSRMIMFGFYLDGRAPFSDIYLHGLVRAVDGKKMSKSLGNVVNPEEYAKEYGVDALRMGLISGTANGKNFAFPKDKIVGYKHFCNKLWNMTRFILMIIEQDKINILPLEEISHKNEEDDKYINLLNELAEEVDQNLKKYRFADAGELIYQFIWHEIADKYIESIKSREDKQVALSVLVHILRTSLELLHPFMPFITEELWQRLPHEGKSIMTTSWPGKK